MPESSELAPVELERRFAELELAFAAELVAATPEPLRRQLGLRIESFERAGSALVCAASPHLMFNRALALGLEAPASDEVLDRMLAALAVPGRPPSYQINVSPSAAPGDLADRLAARGLVPFRRDLLVLTRAPEPLPDALCPFRIERAAPDHAAAFAEILGQAFGVPEPLWPAFAGLVERAGWHIFVGFDVERVVAVGALLVRGRSAYLTAGATRPSHRGAGAHDALIATRLAAARALGCDSLFVDTGTAVPGEPSPSLDNLRSSGFEPRFVRKSLVPPGATWTGAR